MILHALQTPCSIHSCTPSPPASIPSLSVCRPSNTPDAPQSSPVSPTPNPPVSARVISQHDRAFDSALSQIIQHTVYHSSVDLGIPGDMFVDVTPDAYRLLVRYESWREWPGIHNRVDTGSHFPVHGTPLRFSGVRNPKSCWYKITSLTLGRLRIFSSQPYVGASFMPAHELIRRSGIPERPGVQRL